MQKHFDYQSCTLEELAEHVDSTKPSVISTMRAYYTNKNALDMVEKIDEARKIVKRRRLQARLEAM
jgi:hypothetical protein